MDMYSRNRTKPVLSASGLTVEVKSGNDKLLLVDSVDFQIYGGKTLCLVGESGSGKSMTARAILGLCPKPCQSYANSLLIEDINYVRHKRVQVSAVRGDRVSLIPQDPMGALNPLLTIGRQMVEGFLYHKKGTYKDAKSKALELLSKVRISDPETRFAQYTHQLSGGENQRVLIAMSLMCDPAVLIADEPTTALDKTLQLEILTLFRDLQEALGVGILFITHDFDAVSFVGDYVNVMYAGQIVESGSVTDIMHSPAHPYTKSLLSCIPRLDQQNHGKLPSAIEGSVPLPVSDFQGCLFYERCESAVDLCQVDPIELRKIDKERHSRCIVDVHTIEE